MKVLSTIFSFIFYFASSQDYSLYFKRLYYADYLCDKNQFQGALEIYDSLSVNYKYSRQASSSAAVLHFKNGNYTKSANHFLKLASLGVEYHQLASGLQDCALCFSKKDLKKLEEKTGDFPIKYLDLVKKVSTGYNREYDEILKELFIKDQTIRNDFELNEDDPCFKSESNLQNYRIRTTDSLNILELKRLIKKYSALPVLGTVSPKAIDSFGILVAHSSTSSWSYAFCDSLLKQIRRRFVNGNCVAPHFFAFIIDRRMINLKKMNFYGTLKSNEYPMFEPENLNRRREEIFLPPTN